VAVWGIACRLEAEQPVVVAIEATGPRGSLSGREVFRHRANPDVPWAEKLRELAAHLDAALQRARPEAVVVRSMDWTRFRKESVARPRYQVEGVILEVGSHLGVLVEPHSGKSVGKLLGTTKDAAEDEARLAFGSEVEAGAAAIAALQRIGKA
jgi:hypothetical protein